MMETEILDKLFLELSQFTRAKTKREKCLFECVCLLNSMVESGEAHTPTSESKVKKAIDLYLIARYE